MEGDDEADGTSDCQQGQPHRPTCSSPSRHSGPTHGSQARVRCLARLRAYPANGAPKQLVSRAEGERPGALAYPVLWWVGVDPFGSSRSNPSGVCSLPGAVPGLPVTPYCQTSALVAGSIAAIRSW